MWPKKPCSKEMFKHEPCLFLFMVRSSFSFGIIEFLSYPASKAWSVILQEEGIWTQTYTEGRPCEDTARRQPPASQRERAQNKPSLTTHWSHISNLQNCKKLNFLWLSYPIYSTLLLQSPQNNTYSICFFFFFGLVSFTQYNYVVVCVHSLILFIAVFHHMNIQLLCPFTTDEYLDYNIYIYMLSFLFRYYTGMEWLGHMVNVCLTL